MKKFSEQLHKKSQSVKLQAVEKHELRERLVSYMEYHPLPSELKQQKTTAKKSAGESLLTEAYTTVTVPFSRIFKISVAMAVLVLVILPFAAEKSVPGDTLYAIKVEFNEELRSTLTFGTFEKVEWETERLNRRIAEARLLESEGRLTEEVSAGVAKAVKAHTETAKREIEELRTQDADQATIASIALDTTLEVQSTSLKGESGDTGEGDETETVSSPANLIASAIDESRGPAEEYNASSTLPSFEKLMARVEMNTTRVYELHDSISLFATEEQLTEVTRRIEDIERSIQAAIELSSDEDSKGNEAQLHLVGVLQRTQRLIVYMTELKVIETVDIETLVPVELTEAEEETLVTELTAELESKTAEIDKLYDLVEDEAILEKVDVALIEIAFLSEKMASSIDNLAEFRLSSDEALTLATDIIALLERQLVPTESIEGENIEELEQATSSDEIIADETAEETEEKATSTEEVIIPEVVTASSTSTSTDATETATTSSSTVDSV